MSRRKLSAMLGLGAGSAALGIVPRPGGARADGGDIAFAPAPSDNWTSHGFIQRAGGRLHYATLGAASSEPPVVLLHKLGGWIADWRDVAPQLQQDRQVIVFDLPGHGASTWQGPPPQVQSVAETAMLVRGAIEELQRRLGFSRVHLAGTSLGGCIAVTLAALCPDLVSRLALPSCVLGPSKTWGQVREREAGQAAMFTPEGDPLPTPASLSKAVFHLDNAERIAAEQNTSRRLAGRWIRPQERGVAMTDFPALMERVEAPTLLLYGDRDTFFLPDRASAEGHLRDVRCVILPDASGFPVQDQPERTGKALAAFFAARS